MKMFQQLVDAFDYCRSELFEWADVADTVPGVRFARTLALAFIAFEEAGDEEFLSERGEADATGGSVFD